MEQWFYSFDAISLYAIRRPYITFNNGVLIAKFFTNMKYVLNVHK